MKDSPTGIQDRAFLWSEREQFCVHMTAGSWSREWLNDWEFSQINFQAEYNGF